MFNVGERKYSKQDIHWKSTSLGLVWANWPSHSTRSVAASSAADHDESSAFSREKEQTSERCLCKPPGLAILSSHAGSVQDIGHSGLASVRHAIFRCSAMFSQ